MSHDDAAPMNKARPMMLRAPNGQLYPVQSIRAAATKLGQILRILTGEDKKFLTWQGLQNRLVAGDTTFGAGALKGWSFYMCDDDLVQVNEFLVHVGIVPAQSIKEATTQTTNATNTQDNKQSMEQLHNITITLPDQSRTRVLPECNQTDSNLESTCNQSDVRVTSRKVDTSDEFASWGIDDNEQPKVNNVALPESMGLAYKSTNRLTS